MAVAEDTPHALLDVLEDFNRLDDVSSRDAGVMKKALYEEGSATLDVIREAVTALEDLEQTARRVLGGTHPTTVGTEYELRNARAALARETPSPGSP